MTEIPGDVMEAAHDVAERVSSVFEHRKFDAVIPVADIIARAILAERRRCADVARANLATYSKRLGERVAQAIEAGQ